MGARQSDGKRGGGGRDTTSLRWVAILILLLVGLAAAGWLIYRIFVAFSAWFGHYGDVG
jgi:hypothetical protein